MLVSRLRVIAEGADEAVSLALHDTANYVLGLIRLYAPVDTGWLRDSYRKESVSQLHIIVGTSVSYAVHQEFGTSRQAGTPHFIRAFHEAERYFKERLVHYLKNLG